MWNTIMCVGVSSRKSEKGQQQNEEDEEGEGRGY